MAVALVLCAMLLREPAAAASPARPVERRVLAMGTTFDVLARVADRSRGLAAIESAVEEVGRLEERLSTWRGDGPLFRLNRAAPGEEIPLDAGTFAVVTEVFRWAERTGRAFDPTVLPLVRAWDLRGAGRVASSDEIAEALAATGARRFRLDADRKTVARLDARAGIDEGAWGKGYALDRAAARLRAAGVADAWLDLGGEVLAVGNGPERGLWTVPVAHPRDRHRAVALLAMPDGFAVSTSGDSERSRRVAGRTIGHLLDPRTGSPAPDFGSVCVVADSAFVADVLSTAFFVLGPHDGLALSERLRAEGVPNEALFLVDKGEVLETSHSPGMSRFLLSTDPGVAAGAR
jgi:thiamine biosynthesis lipoprotein